MVRPNGYDGLNPHGANSLKLSPFLCGPTRNDSDISETGHATACIANLEHSDRAISRSA
jgi:hypothetical protein